MQISRKNVFSTIFWQKTVLFTCPYGISYYTGLMYVKCFVVYLLVFIILYFCINNMKMYVVHYLKEKQLKNRGHDKCRLCSHSSKYDAGRKEKSTEPITERYLF